MALPNNQSPKAEPRWLRSAAHIPNSPEMEGPVPSSLPFNWLCGPVQRPAEAASPILPCVLCSAQKHRAASRMSSPLTSTYHWSGMPSWHQQQQNLTRGIMHLQQYSDSVTLSTIYYTIHCFMAIIFRNAEGPWKISLSLSLSL